jgi:hypothetical protein
MYLMRMTFHNCQLLVKLAREYQSGQLTAFVGAGVSKGCDLPDWHGLRSGLLDALSRKSFQNPDAPNAWEQVMATQFSKLLASSPPLVAGRYLKEKLGSEYAKTIQRVLYEKDHCVSDTLQELSSLSQLCAVCTYNYDDLLETCPSAPRPHVALAKPSDRPTSGSIPVHHVHGFIPSPSNGEPVGDIILSEDDYHRVYRDSYHWSNTTQLTLLRQCGSLFLGLSFSDPNLRRLLDVVRDENSTSLRVAIKRSPQEDPDSHGGYIFHQQRVKLDEDVMRSLGVEVLWIDDYDTDIPVLNFRTSRALFGG